MGIRVGRGQSPYSKFKAVRPALENCSCVVERYLRMPGVEIDPLIRGAAREERKQLSELLETLCESLLMLSDALGRMGSW